VAAGVSLGAWVAVGVTVAVAAGVSLGAWVAVGIFVGLCVAVGASGVQVAAGAGSVF
jgi:hypothetical protein